MPIEAHILRIVRVWLRFDMHVTDFIVRRQDFSEARLGFAGLWQRSTGCGTIQREHGVIADAGLRWPTLTSVFSPADLLRAVVYTRTPSNATAGFMLCGDGDSKPLRIDDFNLHGLQLHLDALVGAVSVQLVCDHAAQR
jgi:hypothetical protein